MNRHVDNAYCLNGKRLFFLVLLAVLFCGSCQTSDGEDVPPPLNQEQFIPVLLDMQILEATYKQRVVQRANKDSLMSHNYAFIFNKHGITRDQFEESYNYWTKRPEEMRLIYEEIDRLIIEMETEVRNQNAKN